MKYLKEVFWSSNCMFTLYSISRKVLKIYLKEHCGRLNINQVEKLIGGNNGYRCDYESK